VDGPGRNWTDKEQAAEISRCASMAARFRDQLLEKKVGVRGLSPKAFSENERAMLSPCVSFE